jgi:hypothetical protein
LAGSGGNECPSRRKGEKKSAPASRMARIGLSFSGLKPMARAVFRVKKVEIVLSYLLI